MRRSGIWNGVDYTIGAMRALSIECLTAAQLAAKLKMHDAKAHRLMQSLEALGVVEVQGFAPTTRGRGKKVYTLTSEWTGEA